MSHQVEMGKYSNTDTEGSCYRGTGGKGALRGRLGSPHTSRGEGTGKEHEWKELDNEAAVSADTEKQKRKGKPEAKPDQE